MCDEQVEAVFELFERGKWTDHEITRGDAEKIMAEIIGQIGISILAWLVVHSTDHDLSFLCESSKAERLARERGHPHHAVAEGLKVLAE